MWCPSSPSSASPIGASRFGPLRGRASFRYRARRLISYSCARHSPQWPGSRCCRPRTPGCAYFAARAPDCSNSEFRITSRHPLGEIRRIERRTSKINAFRGGFEFEFPTRDFKFAALQHIPLILMHSRAAGSTSPRLRGEVGALLRAGPSPAEGLQFRQSLWRELRPAGG